MPHVKISCYGIELSNSWFNDLIDKSHSCLLATGMFQESNIKIRLEKNEFGSFGGLSKSYIHAEIRLLSGRDSNQLVKASETLMLTIYAQCSDDIEVSVEISEIDTKYLKNSHRKRN